MPRAAALLLATAALLYSAYAQTPVIGGSCKVGTADVQIGGKQTQFFLKCEPTAESSNGEGVWVVKSRSAASPTVSTTAAPTENTQPQQRPPMFKYNPNICEQDNNAREGDSCSVSATCLQANIENPTTFLQCEQASTRWIKKSCQDTFIFNFEQQACIVPKRSPSSLSRQTVSGLVCTYSSCSNSNPCSSGTCNNGYCCSSSGNSGSQIIAFEHNRVKRVRRRALKRETMVLKAAADWPIGPPGRGFPMEISKLDSVLIKARGDGNVCAGGFESPIACGTVGLEPCPVGLHCDELLHVCCPLLLPLVDSRNPSRILDIYRPETGFRIEPESGPIRMHSLSRKPANFAQPSSSSCNGCQQAPQIITIPSCPGGSSSYGSCASTGFCATGYQCIQGSCCPSYSQPSVTVYTCPGGGSAVGNCVSGGCATGYTCSSSNQCCPTTNPFVCSDGTQAAGGCVNGLCGTGYTCTNGLCCASTSSSPKCLDGSPAVGACIPSCTGNGCGGTTLTYYCGSGYTCTTGNICCPTTSCPDGGEPIGPTVNGLCPTGYSAQGNQCCSIVATCLTGETNIGLPVNGLCPTGSTLRGTVCCLTSTTVSFAQACPVSVQLGPCLSTNSAFDTCGGQLGYACRADADGVTTSIPLVCCPLVDYLDPTLIIGPAIGNSCPIDYTPVFIPADGIIECVALSSIPGLCASTSQSGPCISGDCPSGYTCNIYADVCCTDTMSMSRLRNGVPTMPPRSIFANKPQPPPVATACPSGDEPVSACINGLCGAGLECYNKLCCPAGLNPSYGSGEENLSSLLAAAASSSSFDHRHKRLCPNGEEALSSCFSDGSCGDGLVCLGSVCCGTPSVSSIDRSSMHFNQARPSNSAIGAPCQASQQCAGFSEGLSKCERRVCRCTSIAYAKGIACVRKKMLMFNDEPVPVEAESNSIVAAAPPS
ncbi:unnamed protein product, partial [Mesorhabditis belari]|uniref:CC domain-containing protein n=1 Tax=Mesorhabditis belari TaxID=2138241 RepID=A0AAF3EAT0_9BILA